MGEVYRARDTRLQRDVAVKVLPKAVAADSDRRRRFFQEAQDTGALNHPNILSIHDVSLEGDTPYLVTELVEGTTLRDEIVRGPMPMTRVVDLGAQIAAGLQAAHTAGIVHRDLKPENVMVTRDGRAKILDFGLAKTLETAAASGAAAATMTEPGLVLGTAPYMSPQQARGEAVDFRSDQFSFGLVLYEMITGTHPFRRETAVQTMSAIITDEPQPIAEISKKVPLPLRWTIERCLAKDPAGRYASTTDLARDLSTLHIRLAEVSGDVTIRPPRAGRAPLLQFAGIAVTTLAVAIAGWALSRPAANSMEGYRFTPIVTDAVFQSAPAWSPDGRSVAYIAQVDGIQQVFTRSLSSSSLRAQLTRSLFDCSGPFWSPDSSRIYFHAQAQDSQGLWAISVAGGEPELVVPNAFRATMAPDNRTIAFLRRSEGSVFSYQLVVADSFDQAPRVIKLGDDIPALSDAWLRFSPDGSKLLVWFERDFVDDKLYTLVESPFRLVDWRDGSVTSVLNSLISRSERSAVGSFDWLPDGQHIVLSFNEPRSTGRHLWIADLEGNLLEPLTSTPATESFPSVTRDGARVAFTSEAVDFDLIALPLDGGSPRPILATSRNEFDASWSGDQSQYVFVTDRSGSLELWLRSADGQFERPLVTEALFPPGDRTWALGSPAFSPDGSRVAFQRLGQEKGYRLFIATTASAAQPVEFRPGGQSFQDAPTWSPDGAWIAYLIGAQGGTTHLLKARVGGAGEAITLNENVLAFTQPDWSPDGQHVLFVSNDGLAIVPANGGDVRLLSEEQWLAVTWAADGRSILGLREAEQNRHFMLSSIDVTTGAERVINRDVGVIPPANQPIRGLTRLG
jgi:serine/threonine protein kinase